MKHWQSTLIGFLSVLLYSSSMAQERDSSEAFPFFRFQYAYLLPGGDYEDTYGNTSSIGGAFAYKTKSNWQFEIEGAYFFGADIKRKDLLKDIINSTGDVTDADGELVKVIYDMRGLSINASVGKIIPVFNSNKNSGILLQAGIGFIQHRIKIDYRDGEVFQLSDEMLKGYDRLHRGFVLKQFIGYQFFGRKNLFNFYAGLEFNEGFTKNKRQYNYDSRAYDKEQKLDLLHGFKVGWAIPIRSRESEEFYIY